MTLCLFLIAGCASTPAGEPENRHASTGAEVPRGAIPAFVVATRDGETVVVPVDASIDAVRAYGLWVLDESTGNINRPAPEADELGIPECVAVDATHGCPRESRWLLTDSLTPRRDPACTCISGEGSMTCDEDPFAALGRDAWEDTSGVSWAQILARRAEGDADDEDDDRYADGDGEDCGDSDDTSVWMHGGVLYGVGVEHNGCEGSNTYETYRLVTELTADAVVEGPADPSLQWRCVPDGAFLDSWATSDPIVEFACTLEGGEWHDDYGDIEACVDCDRLSHTDGPIPFLINGRLFRTAGVIFTSGGGPRYATSSDVRPEDCTVSDPCGSPAGFPALIAAAEADPGVRFFVSSTGEQALIIESDEARVHHRDGDSNATVSVPVSVPGPLLGVRFHADASRLITAMTLSVEGPTPAEPTACAWGQELVDDACVTRCAATEDCRATHGCETLCVGGTCQELEVACTETHPCAAGARCEAYRCVPLPLAPADASFVDHRGGSDWGNRCVVHLREGELDAAQAACARGLDMASRDTTRGALLYNLGLIAVRRGETALARLYFEASLVPRPSATVEQALEEAGGPLFD